MPCNCKTTDQIHPTEKSEHLQTALEYLWKVADRLGYKLNPDERTLDRIASYMAENKKKYNRYYCPCKQHYPVKADVDPICPCAESRDEITRDGHCECHVFFDVAAFERAKMNPGLLSAVACPG